MSAEYEYAMERKIVARHEIVKLQARSLYGDDAPTAEEWRRAFVESREASFAVAFAEIGCSK